MLAGKIPVGRLVFKAIERHLADLRAGAVRGIRWDDDNAIHAIEFFEKYLCLAEGEHEGKPFILGPWQQFVIGSIFGWMSGDVRRFRTVYVEIGKGNGKSPMAAGIGLYGLLADGEAAAEIYSAAVVKDQAKILFRDAENMRDASPMLKSRIEKHVNNLSVLTSNSYFRPISSEKRGLDGKRVHMALIDELHEHPNSIVVDKMRAGTKGRRQALIFEITNSGYDRKSVCFNHHEYSTKILDGALENDSWFAYVCMLDVCAKCEDEGKISPSCEACDQWDDEKTWLKPNPNLGVSIHPKYLREQVQEAKGMPSKENIVQRLNFCIWNEQNIRWMPMDKWDACGSPVVVESLRKKPCYAGLDLANVSDLAALVLLFDDEYPKKVLPFFWIPEESVTPRTKRDGVPYEMWVKQGLIKAIPGPVIDHRVIRQDILELRNVYDFKEIDYDEWNATQLATELGEDGFEMVGISQGMASLTSATKELETLVRAGGISHGGNAVLRWNASNCSVKMDPSGNIKLDKEKSTEKIDGVAALVNALARAIRVGNETSVYDEGASIFL